MNRTRSKAPIHLRDGVHKGQAYILTIYEGTGCYWIDSIEIDGLPRIRDKEGDRFTTLEGAVAAGHTMARDFIEA
ncbi:MAG TPA: hypothetical protein VFH59_09405 [Frateuria sp.]|uniref:hypothetical protein n=1 Tax=Frateuria sp. TaxID=2211372 RepID=UPI002D810330|nr:hypothetical protein [Frateuria sp.]HET6805641.1 hypothetical protein [Frateuria sp.]